MGRPNCFKTTFENSCRFFGFDPFTHTPQERATVAALRAEAIDVYTSTVTKNEYRTRYKVAADA